MQVLDFGYVNLVETWGSDERIIEAARMSTDKGFQGWGERCKKCGITQKAFANDFDGPLWTGCINRTDHEWQSGDEKLLRYLWENKHMTPFEMAGMIIEIQAPIFVVREWQRHRTQSYNELSGRYTTLPDLYYIPSIERLMAGKQAIVNKQSSERGFDADEASVFQDYIGEAADIARGRYEQLLEWGVSRELARLVIPVNQYTRFRASANLRNWLAFLALRLDKSAQWEIRQFADVVAVIVKDAFPRTYTLFEDL